MNKLVIYIGSLLLLNFMFCVNMEAQRITTPNNRVYALGPQVDMIHIYTTEFNEKQLIENSKIVAAMVRNNSKSGTIIEMKIERKCYSCLGCSPSEGRECGVGWIELRKIKLKPGQRHKLGNLGSHKKYGAGKFDYVYRVTTIGSS